VAKRIDMRVLLTGAFGHVGSHCIGELLRQGHTVRCFDVRNPLAESRAARFGDRIERLWGDIRNEACVRAAVSRCEVIIHLAAIIPPLANEKPDLAREVNVDGMRHLLDAAQAQHMPPKFLFGSTFDLFGHTRHLPPPRRVTDPIVATDSYTEHKLACEMMLANSNLTWSIFRFSDVPHIALRKAHPIMFEIRLDTRIEVIHPLDLGLALTNALGCDHVWGKILLIGGGASCQTTFGTFVGRLLTAMGIGPLPEEAFTTNEYCTDWLDTEESQRLLRYQRASFDDIVNQVAALLGWRKYVIPFARPFVRRSMLALSPYWRDHQRRRF
jgi:UDP-glucose 4-epimerase